MRPEVRAVRFDQPQFALLGFAPLKQFFAPQVVDILILFEDEARDRLLHQRAVGSAQKSGGGEIGFQDQSLFGQSAVAHRGQVIKVEIARPSGFDLGLGPAQLLVLHLQPNLVHPQCVELLLNFLGREGRAVFGCPGGPFPGKGFGLAAQFERIARCAVFHLSSRSVSDGSDGPDASGGFGHRAGTRAA